MKRTASLFSIVLLCLLFAASSYGQSPNSGAPNDGWKTSTPEAQGIDSRVLLQMFQSIQANGGSGLHSLLIVRNGYLVAEGYFAPYHKDTLHNIKSASKSILSALVGIALDKKKLKSLDQKVADFYPDYVNEPRKRDITLRHLLTMTAGLDWNNDREIGGAVPPYDLELWKTVSMRDDPGTKFVYNTMLVHMMSAILTKATGEGTKEYADSVLFDPLGISDVQWSKDNQGIYIGGSELFLKPRDMAKFGQLYLDGGVWNGRQIVPKAWVAESTSPKTAIGIDSCSGNPDSYGYWWWIPSGTYQARGANGQYIIVKPDLKMVVVATSENQCAALQYLYPYVFRAASGTGPLPANPQSAGDLQRLLALMENPPAKAVGRLPDVAARVSGKKYVLAPNEMGIQSIVLTFRDRGLCTAEVVLGKTTINFPIGLDGNFRFADAGTSFGNNSKSSRFASIGSWVNDRTFAFKFHILGDVVTQNFSLNFVGDDVSLDINDSFSAKHIKGKKAQ